MPIDVSRNKKSVQFLYLLLNFSNSCLQSCRKIIRYKLHNIFLLINDRLIPKKTTLIGNIGYMFVDKLLKRHQLPGIFEENQTMNFFACSNLSTGEGKNTCIFSNLFYKQSIFS